MNQIVKLMHDSNERMRKLMMAIEGSYKPDMEIISACQQECRLQVKTLNVIATFYGIASKNKRTMQGLERMNIMDESTAIEIGLTDLGNDKVKCPELDKLITKEECLDYSGSDYDLCSGCIIGKEVKKKLLPPE